MCIVCKSNVVLATADKPGCCPIDCHPEKNGIHRVPEAGNSGANKLCVKGTVEILAYPKKTKSSCCDHTAC